MDELVKIYGREGATVYGVIWRYTQMESGKCTVSQARIGRRAGLSRKTVNKYIQLLIASGFIADETPGLKNRAHTYSMLIEPVIGIELRAGVTWRYTSVTQGDMKNSTVPKNGTVLKNKELKNHEKKPRKRTPNDDVTDAICEVCAIDVNLNGALIGKIRTELMAAGYNDEDVRAFGRWWHSDKWRHEQGPPTVFKLRERIAVVRTPEAAPSLAAELKASGYEFIEEA